MEKRDNSLLSDEKNIVLFDGVCNLCNGAVNFLIDIDHQQKLHFASLQSSLGQAILGQQGMNLDELDTFLYVRGEQVYTRSRAALEVLRTVGGLWQLGYVFMLVPGFIRDAVYKMVSRHRYRWFGKLEACRIPTPELKARFL
jgi:predicted DCC family thiol-disulfide oxidoreductase YuxK